MQVDLEAAYVVSATVEVDIGTEAARMFGRTCRGKSGT
jgi:hypothetical protein